MSKSLATWFTPSLQTISRSAGRSAVAAAAYRACVKLIDQTTGLIHDYTKKKGHVATVLIGASDISELWNKAGHSPKQGQVESKLPGSINDHPESIFY